jgi:hypothetical protein
MPPFDWDGLGRRIAVVAVQIGQRLVEHGEDAIKRGVEHGVDAALEDVDRALAEGRRRVKQARGKIPKPPAGKEPQVEVIEGKFEDEDDA